VVGLKFKYFIYIFDMLWKIGVIKKKAPHSGAFLYLKHTFQAQVF